MDLGNSKIVSALQGGTISTMPSMPLPANLGPKVTPGAATIQVAGSASPSVSPANTPSQAKIEILGGTRSVAGTGDVVRPANVLGDGVGKQYVLNAQGSRMTMNMDFVKPVYATPGNVAFNADLASKSVVEHEYLAQSHINPFGVPGYVGG